MKRTFWLMVWVVAVVALSQCFAVGRLWPGHGSAGLALRGVATGAVLGAAMFLLALRTYACERVRGKVVRPIRLFERILERGADDHD